MHLNSRVLKAALDLPFFEKKEVLYFTEGEDEYITRGGSSRIHREMLVTQRPIYDTYLHEGNKIEWI